MAGKIYYLLFIILFSDVRMESVFKGSRVIGDTLLHRSEEVKIPYFYIRSTDVAFPKYYEDAGIISAISITDNIGNGFAEIDYGGVGLSYANIHLRSALWGGFNFTVEIYGIKQDNENTD